MPVSGQAGATARTTYDALNPGGLTEFHETVPITIVYAGIEPDTAAVEAELPATGAPITRLLEFYYGIKGDLGIRYDYEFHHVVADPAWTESLYARMDALAGAHEAHEFLTVYQAGYNAQPAAARQLVEADNQWIDAPTMEDWLTENAPAGVDTTMPTIFYIDRSIDDGWYPHLYSKTNEPDPDTGFNYGFVRHARKVTGWGGTAADDDEDGDGTVNRVWFYDLSAGPELFAGSFDVTNPDLDGDGLADYRIPPGWHYGPDGYQHPGYPGTASLSTDLGKVTRYVGVNALFTSSPLFPPFYTDDRIPETVNIDINTVEAWSGVNASETLLDPAYLLEEHQGLPTGMELSVDSADVAFAGAVKQCYFQWIKDVPCYVDRHPQYPGFANLFLNWAHRDYEDGDADYEAAVVNYAIGSVPKVNQFLLGYADDNWLDAAQSGSFVFVDKEVADAGIGLTGTAIHEFGHHSSMSHPHDAYDGEAGFDYGPSGDFYFAWLGDYTSTSMSYIRLNWDFSQFDQDNSARHHAAGFAMIANRVAAAIGDRPDAGAALTAADASLAAARSAFAGHEYVAALGHAEAAYRTLLAWADANGVPVTVQVPTTWTLLPESKLGHLVRTLHGPAAGLTDRNPTHNEKWARH